MLYIFIFNFFRLYLHKLNFNIMVIVYLALIVLYFIPTIIADSRNSIHKVSIFILNLFLGWTFLGWLVSLIWAFSSSSSSRIDY
jgi:Superinfection immunity protein